MIVRNRFKVAGILSLFLAAILFFKFDFSSHFNLGAVAKESTTPIAENEVLKDSSISAGDRYSFLEPYLLFVCGFCASYIKSLFYLVKNVVFPKQTNEQCIGTDNPSMEDKSVNTDKPAGSSILFLSENLRERWITLSNFNRDQLKNKQALKDSELQELENSCRESSSASCSKNDYKLLDNPTYDPNNDPNN